MAPSTACSMQNTSQLALSCFEYSQTTLPWKEYSIGAMSVLGIILNVAVIAWRLKRGSSQGCVAHWSLLIINLATADGLFALSRITSIAAMKVAGTWFQDVTALTKGLCVTSFIINHFSVVQSVLIMAGVALLAVRESIGLCGTRKRNPMSGVKGLLISFWIMNVAYAVTFSFFVDYTIGGKNGSRVISWSTCWDFFIPNRDYQPTNLTTAVILTVLIAGVLMSYTVIFFAIKKYEASSMISLVGIKLLTIVFVDGILNLFVVVWSLFCLLQYENKTSLMSPGEVATNIASAYAVSMAALLNPILYTLLDKSVWNRCRRRRRRPNLTTNTDDVASIPCENTRLFSDT